MPVIKVDLTGKRSRQFEPILMRYDVKGVPTVVFITAAGKECKDLRLVDFEKPAQFLNRMMVLDPKPII